MILLKTGLAEIIDYMMAENAWGLQQSIELFISIIIILVIGLLVTSVLFSPFIFMIYYFYKYRKQDEENSK